MATIRASGLTKRYGDEIAVSDLDLTVEEGEVFGFLGPNGAGKTTTIDLLLDFIRPSSGTATVLGYDAQAETQAVRDRVGILPDGFELWDRSSGYRHLEFALDSLNGDENSDELLDRVGLDRADAKRPVGEYSKGMTQRLSMAMALVGDPDLLILDEPSSGLDPHGIQQMQRIVREVANDGTTVFFSSHILGQVATVCDRVGILDEGELVTVDTLSDLRENVGVPSSLLIELEGDPMIDLSELDGVTGTKYHDEQLRVEYTDSRVKATVINHLVESGAAVHDFTIQEPTLEDVFSAFTGTNGRQQNTKSDDVDEGEEDSPPTVIR